MCVLLLVRLIQSNVSNDLVKKVFVAGLNKGEISEDDLKGYFNTIAKVKSVSIVRDKQTDQPKGYAFVELDYYYMVDKAACKKSLVFLSCPNKFCFIQIVLNWSVKSKVHKIFLTNSLKGVKCNALWVITLKTN